MTPSTRKKGIVTSLGVLTAVATLLSGGVTTAYANDALANPNSAMGYPSFKGAADPIPGTGVAFDPSTSYLKQVFDADVANGAGTDTAHDFWIDKMLTRTGTAPNGTGTNDAGDYNYAGADKNEYLFSRGRAAFMYTHTPEALGFVGDVAYWDQTGNDGFTVEVSIGGSKQTLRENTDKRKQTPSYFTTEFTNGDKTITVTEVKYITYTNVMVANFTITSTTFALLVDANGVAPLFSRENLGAMLAITPEHASRVVTDFRRNGAISDVTAGRCRCNLAQLSRLAAGDD